MRFTINNDMLLKRLSMETQTSVANSEQNNLLEWLNDMLAFQEEERHEIVEEILNSYIATLADEHPDKLKSLLNYLKSSENNLLFKKALNSINLVVALTFMAKDENQYQQGVRRILMDARTDGEHEKFMKKYYIQNLDQDDFSGIIFSQEDYDLILQRFVFFQQTYESLFI